MKKNYWLILGMLVATGVVAQESTNTLPPIPAPIVTPTESAASAPVPQVEPAKKTAPAKPKKAAPKRAKLNEPKVALVPGTAEVAVASLNVRGQAGLKGETIAHLKKDEIVTVLSQTNLDKHETGDPAQWAKIALPSSTAVWVNNSFINGTTKTVVPKRLNLRAGPGENFSVLGVVEHGAAVKEITRKGAWTQIEPPETACGFVAAMYLKQVSSGTTVAANVPSSTETALAVPEPTPTPVPEPAPIMTEPAPAPVPAPEPALAEPSNPEMVDTNPPPPRVVSHEGVVKSVGSIIAPTAYVLYDPATGKEINYLYTTSSELDISRYNGMRIIVTGEEGMAKRWQDTPVLTIQRIVVLETNALNRGERHLDYRIPRQIN